MNSRSVTHSFVFFLCFFVNTAITSGLFLSFLEYHSDFVENSSFIRILCVFCNIFNSLSTIRAENSFDYEIQNLILFQMRSKLFKLLYKYSLNNKHSIAQKFIIHCININDFSTEQLVLQTSYAIYKIKIESSSF